MNMTPEEKQKVIQLANLWFSGIGEIGGCADDIVSDVKTHLRGFIENINAMPTQPEGVLTLEEVMFQIAQAMPAPRMDCPSINLDRIEAYLANKFQTSAEIAKGKIEEIVKEHGGAEREITVAEVMYWLDQGGG